MINKENKKYKAIKICRKCRTKIMNWSRSQTEVGFLCAGKRKKITQVFKVKNDAKFPLHRFKWNSLQRRKFKKQIRKQGLILIAEGHSHPDRRHLQHPSAMDLKYFNRKRPHLIVLPQSNVISGWKLKETVQKTLKNRISIKDC